MPGQGCVPLAMQSISLGRYFPQIPLISLMLAYFVEKKMFTSSGTIKFPGRSWSSSQRSED